MKYKLIKEYPGSPKLGYIYNPEQFEEYCNYTEFWEEVIEKVKIPLFTSEDGVDIFEGDKVYYVETDDELENSFKVNTYKVLKYPGRFTSDNTLHSFSTKKKAEEYILLNKPVLSLKNIADLSLKSYTTIELGIKLRKLVKSKIQQSV